MSKKPHIIFCCTMILLAVPAQAQAAPAAPSSNEKTPASPPAVKVPDTLMFTIDELNEIQSRISGNSTEKKEDRAIEDASLYLSTIIYVSPQEWTIWLNGKPINSGDEFQSFKVVDISPSSVQLLVPLSAQGMIPVRLGPNQTFVTRSGVVVEGQVK
ncbi:MAG: hypothetical protein ACYCZX_15760 [Rhodospirillaceae bacterium]